MLKYAGLALALLVVLTALYLRDSAVGTQAESISSAPLGHPTYFKQGDLDRVDPPIVREAADEQGAEQKTLVQLEGGPRKWESYATLFVTCRETNRVLPIEFPDGSRSAYVVLPAGHFEPRIVRVEGSGREFCCTSNPVVFSSTNSSVSVTMGQEPGWSISIADAADADPLTGAQTDIFRLERGEERRLHVMSSEELLRYIEGRTPTLTALANGSGSVDLPKSEEWAIARVSFSNLPVKAVLLSPSVSAYRVALGSLVQLEVLLRGMTPRQEYQVSIRHPLKRVLCESISSIQTEARLTSELPPDHYVLSVNYGASQGNGARLIPEYPLEITRGGENSFSLDLASIQPAPLAALTVEVDLQGEVVEGVSMRVLVDRLDTSEFPDADRRSKLEARPLSTWEQTADEQIFRHTFASLEPGEYRVELCPYGVVREFSILKEEAKTIVLAVDDVKELILSAIWATSGRAPALRKRMVRWRYAEDPLSHWRRIIIPSKGPISVAVGPRVIELKSDFIEVLGGNFVDCTGPQRAYPLTLSSTKPIDRMPIDIRIVDGSGMSRGLSFEEWGQIAYRELGDTNWLKRKELKATSNGLTDYSRGTVWLAPGRLYEFRLPITPPGDGRESVTVNCPVDTSAIWLQVETFGR